MFDEKENIEQNNILHFEDLFKDELKRKKQYNEPIQNKNRYTVAIIYYLLVMFIVAGIIQIIFISNDENIHRIDTNEQLLIDLVNDPYGVGIIKTSEYEKYLSTYDSYLEVMTTDGIYSVVYSEYNDYIYNEEILANDETYQQIISGTLNYWDDHQKSLVTIYATLDYSNLSALTGLNVSLVSLATPVLDEIINDPNAITIMDQSLYDTYYANYHSDLLLRTIHSTYYFIYNQNNPDVTAIATYSEQTLISILEGSYGTTWSDLSAIYVYEFEGQDTFIDSTQLQNYYIIQIMDWDLTGLASGMVNFLIYLILLPVVYIILKPNLAHDIELTKKDNLSKIFGYAVAGYLILIIGNLISQILSSGLSFIFNEPIEQSVNQLAIESILHSNGAVFMVLSAVLMGPIVEELIFRKSVFGLIKNQYVALAVSSIAFGSVHLIGEGSFVSALINGISYIVMGFVFGIIYMKNQKNILYPILVHILTNLISVATILFYM